MLQNSLPYLEGALRLDTLLTEAELSEDDSDVKAFKLVASEVEHLPIGRVREYWSKDALENLESDMERATIWAKKTTIRECESLAARFKTH